MMLGGCAYQSYDDDYDYDGYYDDHYGPYDGGYWGSDGFFWFWRTDRYHRDDGRHFRRDPFPAGRRFRGDRDGPHRKPPPGKRPPPDGPQPPPPHRPPRDGQRPPRPSGEH
jgi:hypothetical protein